MKLPTDFLADERVLACSKDAVLVYLAVVCWCDEKRTDGHLARPQLVSAASLARPKRVRSASSELVSQRLWDETDDGWYVIDYPRWGQLADTRSYQAQRNREKQERYRRRQGSNPVTDSVTDPVSNRGSNRLVTGSRTEQKRKPPVVPLGGDAAPAPKPPRKTQVPEDFKPDEQQLEWAARERPGVDVAAEVAKFVDYHRAKGNTFVDHQRAFRTWMRNTRVPVSANGQAHRQRSWEIPDVVEDW